MTPITAKDTKQVLWDSYSKLLEKYELLESQKMVHAPEKSPRVLPKSSDFFSGIEDLKRTFLSDLDRYAEQTREKFTVIDLLTEELRDTEKQLKNANNISTEVESLYALIELQRQKTQEFDAEIESRKRTQKQQEIEWEYAFETRKRAEEFSYRQKSEEAKRSWDEQIAKKSVELSMRESNISAREVSIQEIVTENQELKKSMESLPMTLEKTITDRLTTAFATEQRFTQKEYEMQASLSKMELKNLEEKVSEIQKQNIELQKSFMNANTRMEWLATKVVESGRPVVVGRGE